MPGGERVHAHDVHVRLDCLPGHLGRRLEQWPDVHVEAEVGEGGGEDLLPAVVAVLTHLGNEDPWPTTLRLLESCGGRARLLDRVHAGTGLLAIHAGDRPDRRRMPTVDRLQRV